MSVVILPAPIANVADERDGVRQVVAAKATTDKTEINGRARAGLSVQSDKSVAILPAPIANVADERDGVRQGVAAEGEAKRSRITTDKTELSGHAQMGLSVHSNTSVAIVAALVADMADMIH